MNIFFQVVWNAQDEVWVATAYEPQPLRDGKPQPPKPVARATDEEPTSALQSCVERVEDL